MAKKIWFNSSDELAGLIVEKPVLAKKCVPEWFRSMPPSVENNRTSFRNRDNLTVKSCMPFFDSITSGYMQTTWTDIHISDDGLTYNYSSPPEPIFIRARQNEHGFPIPKDYAQVEYIWKIPHLPQSSVGSSCLITHPLNRLDLPFYTLSGVIDTDDDFFVKWGSLPFYVKKGFNGLIPAGTPMFQVIPFTREKWQMVDVEISEEERIKRHSKIAKHFTGAYRKMYRKPKFWQ